MIIGVVSFFAAAFMAAAITRRAVAIAVSAAVWPIYFVGLLAGLWGYGVGDNWQYLAAALTAAGTLGAFIGLAIGRAVAGPPHSRGAGTRRSWLPL